MHDKLSNYANHVLGQCLRHCPDVGGGRGERSTSGTAGKVPQLISVHANTSAAGRHDRKLMPLSLQSLHVKMGAIAHFLFFLRMRACLREVTLSVTVRFGSGSSRAVNINSFLPFTPCLGDNDTQLSPLSLLMVFLAFALPRPDKCLFGFYVSLCQLRKSFVHFTAMHSFLLRVSSVLFRPMHMVAVVVDAFFLIDHTFYNNNNN